MPQIGDPVGRHRRQTQAAGSGRDRGRPDRLREDALGQQALAEGHRVVGLADHQRHDLRLGPDRLESLGPQSLAEGRRIRPQAFDALGSVGKQLERRPSGGDGGGRRGGREDERPRGVDEEVHQLARAADVGAVAAERLAERADDHVDLVGDSGGRDRAAPAGSDAAGGVGLVDEQAAAVAPSEVRELRQWSDVPVHREDAVGDDQRGASRRSSQAPLEMLGVGVPIDEGLRPRQTAAVDDARVVELVREDDLARAARAPRSCPYWRDSPTRTAGPPRFP